MNMPIFALVLLPFAAAFLCRAVGRKNEENCAVVSTACCALTFALCILCAVFAYGESLKIPIFGFSFSLGGFHAVYGIVSAFMWSASALLSHQYFKGHHNKSRYNFFLLLTLGATMGVFLSADLFTTFIFFEIMSFTSYVWVVQEQTDEAMAAGKTYITIAALGGMVALMGLFLLYNITGTLEIDVLYEAVSASGKSAKLYVCAFCLLFGFGAKAGMFPLHIWLPKAHPVAPAPASALLSGVLTKAGVFGILVITGHILRDDKIWGYTLLALAVVTMVLGAVLAVFSVNLKRTLACSSLSQIGFILTGVSMITLLGEENALAANGTFLYMINHSVVKLVLFLAAGAIYMSAHTLDLNKLRGFGRGKPFLAVIFLVGACSLAGVPGFCGYISKTLVHESIVEYAHHAGTLITVVEWLFLFSGGLTVAYMTKLFVAIFIEKGSGDGKKMKLSLASKLALIFSAIPLIVLGILPHALSEKITQTMLPLANGHAFHHAVEYTAWANLKGVLISLLIGAVVYFVFVRTLLIKRKDGRKTYICPWSDKLSLENLVYVPVCKGFIAAFGALLAFFDKLPERLIGAGIFVLSVICRAADDVTDFFALLLRKTVLGDTKEIQVRHKHRVAYAVGSVLDKLTSSEEHTHAKKFSRVMETVSHTTSRIFGNFSFALLMACLGICTILLLLIFVF
ncbi:MAG: sodium:proton antiporter [Clostridia bacterium]|nr:sodium:proton antiporter [Clostridia bacterium]